MEESGSRYGSASVQIIKDPDSDPGGQKFCKSGSGTLLIRLFKMVVSPSTWKQRGTRCRNRFACRHGSEWRHPRWCRWWWWCPPQLSSPPSRQLMRAGRAGARVSARPGTRTSGGAAPWTRHWWWFGLQPCRMKGCCTLKERLAIFPSPAGMSFTKLSLAGKLLTFFTVC